MYLDARLQQNVTKDRKFKDSGYKKPQRGVEHGTNRQMVERTQDNAADSRRESVKVCYQCKQHGHISRYFPRNKRTSKDSGRPDMTASF